AERQRGFRAHERRLESKLIVRIVVDAVDLKRDVSNEGVVHPEADRGPAIEPPETAAARVLDSLVEAVRETPLELALLVREGSGRLGKAIADSCRDAVVGVQRPGRGQGGDDPDDGEPHGPPCVLLLLLRGGRGAEERGRGGGGRGAGRRGGRGGGGHPAAGAHPRGLKVFPSFFWVRGGGRGTRREEARGGPCG